MALPIRLFYLTQPPLMYADVVRQLWVKAGTEDVALPQGNNIPGALGWYGLFIPSNGFPIGSVSSRKNGQDLDLTPVPAIWAPGYRVRKK